MDLLAFVSETTVDDAARAAQRAHVRQGVLAASRHLRTANFGAIHPHDLRLVFEHYDACVFGGRIARRLDDTPLTFGLAPRMTSAAGKTAVWTDRRSGRRRYELRVSTAVLFGCFRADDHRPVLCCGLVCADRLDALQRVMEHEITHLLELLLWDHSRCAQARFQAIARRLFGHTEHTHALITPAERAFVSFGVHPGAKVRFRFAGVEYRGVVNRVGKRATVLVEDPRGAPYDDGKHYAKFYVPVADVALVE